MKTASCRRASCRRSPRRARQTSRMLLRALDAGLGACERVFLVAANGLLLLMLAINLANILSRLFFDLGIIWVFPWTEVLFVWMIFLGFFVIYRRGQDISVDILVRQFG